MQFLLKKSLSRRPATRLSELKGVDVRTVLEGGARQMKLAEKAGVHVVKLTLSDAGQPMTGYSESLKWTSQVGSSTVQQLLLQPGPATST